MNRRRGAAECLCHRNETEWPPSGPRSAVFHRAFSKYRNTMMLVNPYTLNSLNPRGVVQMRKSKLGKETYGKNPEEVFREVLALLSFIQSLIK